MSLVANWLRENTRVYYRNATAVRDFRVQLRGNRAVMLWAVYLLILIAFGMFTYNEAASRQEMSVVEAQASLQSFYSSVMTLLTTMIILIAPALSATAVISERQRRSLDLLFSAPVSAKYYLVGKLISSYRYIWMLLVLSLPITAACVVLGGAIWSEVLASYALMSLHGLIFTTIALLFSTLAQKPAGAVVWAYLGVACYIILVSMIAIPMTFRPMMMGGMQTNELPFVVCLSPYSFTRVASSYTDLFGYHVPNWALAGIFSLVVIKLILLGAASVLSPFGSPETKSLRIHGLIYTFLLVFWVSISMGAAMGVLAPVISSAASGGMGGSYSPPDYELYFSRMFVGIMLLFTVVMPVISCYGTELEKRFWPDGIFNIKRILVATPSGGLPYLAALVLAGAGGVAFYGLWAPQVLGVRFAAYVFYTLALFFACWSIGRLTSAMNNGLRYARTLHFTILVLLLAIPVPFFSIADPYGYGSKTSSIWDLYILRPLFNDGDKTALAMIYGTLLIIAGLFILKGSESLAKAKYLRAGIEYERA
jgi:ABC-type transport system involved in multi-copper enzyme maturation permease subunit